VKAKRPAVQVPEHCVVTFARRRFLGPAIDQSMAPVEVSERQFAMMCELIWSALSGQ